MSVLREKASLLNKQKMIDAVVLDELLRGIVDSSMSDLRHRLQEAVFATSFRRKIMEQHATSSSESKSANLEKLLDDYIKPQKLSLALETFTQPPTLSTTVIPVQLVTADDVAIQESGRLFKDDVEYSEPWKLPKVPMFVAITVIVMCILTFILLTGTVIYFFASKSKTQKMKLRMERMRNQNPLSVQGLSTCHVSPQNFPGSRRNSVYLDQDRAASSIWAHP
uniref:INF2 n=1 Tax=Caenorhabditis tropicalis TaxID=1561998 RepID=A0A1I7UGB4_9PELO